MCGLGQTLARILDVRHNPGRRTTRHGPIATDIRQLRPFHPPRWAFVLSAFFRLAGFRPRNGAPANSALLKSSVAVLNGLTVRLAALVSRRLGGRNARYAAGAFA